MESRRLFKKGDRVRIIKTNWTSLSRNAIIFHDEKPAQKEVGFQVDGFDYTPDDFHSLEPIYLELVAVVTSSSGCLCMRCNSENKWAEPNRPGGKYLCFECR